MPKKQQDVISVKIRKDKNAELVREFLGNKCVICGYDTSYWALEAHHVYKKNKKFTLGKTMTRALDKSLKEASKCVLLCSNCHREHHHGLISTERLSQVLKDSSAYREKFLSNREKLISIKKESRTNRCQDCNTIITVGANRCLGCSFIHRTSIDWPSTKKLIQMVTETSYSATARKLGVSDNGVRRRIKNHPDK